MSASVTTASLAARMKAHEHLTRTMLPARTLKVVRVDGQAFHTYTRDLDRPFDVTFAEHMDAVGLALAEMIPGTVCAYVQSDEVSVLFHDYATPTTQPWLGGVVAKIVSLTAARSTATFNALRPAGAPATAALFDSRVFTLPDPGEGAAYLRWRQRDAVRNAVSMAAQTHFSPAELHGATTSQKVAMLAERGIDFDTYPPGFRRGRLVTLRPQTYETTWTHERTAATTTQVVTRHRWAVGPAPMFDALAAATLLPTA